MDYLAIILIIMAILSAIILLFAFVKSDTVKPYSQSYDHDFLKNKWAEVQTMLKNGGPANYKQAILEADKLVDLVLKSKVKGSTMGERLKNSRNLFEPSIYNELWSAHKIRNKVAHEADFEGLSSDAVLAVRNFEKALKELKAL